MIEAVRQRMARRAALEAVASRRVGERRSPGRTLLLCLPAGEAGQRAAWALVADLDLRPADLLPVVLDERVAYAPDTYAGHVTSLGPDARDWRRLPKRPAVEALWARSPDVALNLAATSDLAAAYLVGASPAPVRIGPFAAGDEPFYDLMVKDEPDGAAMARAVRRLLGQVTPPILPLR